VSIAVALVDDSHRQALTRFLDAQPDATLFHSAAWSDVVRATYGHDVRHWVARSGDEIVGSFSATVMRVPGLGCKYIASPYQMYSGLPLADDDSIASALVTACAESARKDGAQYVEVRHFEDAPLLASAGFVAAPSGLVTTTIPLSSLALSQAEHGHRQRVRKAEKLGVDVFRSESLDDLRVFRRMYLATGRAMGAPQAGWRYFAETFDRMRDRMRLYLARREGQIVGGFLVLADRRLAFARCSAHSSRESLAVNAGHALWWRALQDAAADGCPAFNCGVSSAGDPGLIKWKEGWGGTSKPVHVFVLPLRSSPPEAGGYFEGYGLAKAVWKKLPLRVVDLVGHQVTRWIG